VLNEPPVEHPTSSLTSLPHSSPWLLTWAVGSIILAAAMLMCCAVAAIYARMYEGRYLLGSKITACTVSHKVACRPSSLQFVLKFRKRNSERSSLLAHVHPYGFPVAAHIAAHIAGLGPNKVTTHQHRRLIMVYLPTCLHTVTMGLFGGHWGLTAIAWATVEIVFYYWFANYHAPRFERQPQPHAPKQLDALLHFKRVLSHAR